MIDHLGLKVRNFEASKMFFLQALKPLGYELIMEFPNAAGLGAGGKPDLWISAGDHGGHPAHIAFASRDREAVDAFHAAALAAGGQDHGAPGLREHYHPNYYGAFIIDPEGNNIEAVCHHAPGSKVLEEAKEVVARATAKAREVVTKARAKAKAMKVTMRGKAKGAAKAKAAEGAAKARAKAAEGASKAKAAKGAAKAKAARTAANAKDKRVHKRH